MEINLEKIEIVKDRTGSTYAQAKEALERADGSVVDAIIDIEDQLNKEFDRVDGGSLKDSPIFAKMKDIIEKGNVSKILIAKGGKTVVSFPLTAGVIGAVLVPWGAIIGAVAAVGTQCEIQFVDDQGKVIDINGSVVGMYDKAKDAVSKVGESDTVDDVKEAFVKGTAKLMSLWDKLDKSGKIDEVKDAVDKVAKRAVDTAKDIAKEATERNEKAREEAAETPVAEETKDEEIN